MPLKVIAYTDGSCLGNPGPGGWAVLFKFPKGEKLLSGGAPKTTNNAMELTAVLEAVKKAPVGVTLEVHTDSRNVIGWLSEGWKVKATHLKPLVEAIRATAEQKRLALRFVATPAHTGENARVDRAAKDAARSFQAAAQV